MENDKINLQNFISEERKSLDLKLKDSFEILPAHYKKQCAFEDMKLYKRTLALYGKEDKIKSTYMAEIGELDKEIAKKAKIESEIQELINKKIELKERISTNNKRLNEELNGKYINLPEHYKKIPLNDLELDKKVREIFVAEDKEKGKLITTAESLEKEIERKSEVQNKLKEVEPQMSELQNELSGQKQVLKDLTYNEELEYDLAVHEGLEEKNSLLDKKMKECEKGIWGLKTNIENLSEDNKDLNDKIEELGNLENLIEGTVFDRDVNEIARDEISLTAKALREQVMERTEKYVATFLPKITNNKYRDVKISEDFNITVYSPEKNDFESIKSLSGGTRDQVLFALRLAFTNAIIGGRSRSKGFALFLDEFLGSFDQNRRDKTLIMLKELKDYFRQIFLITHIEGIEMDVDQIIKTPEI